MNREEFIESLQAKGFYDVDIDAEKVNDYFKRKDFEGSEPRIVGSMRLEDIAVLIWLDRADDEVTPGIHLDFLEPMEERNEYAEYLPTDEKKENPFFYNGSYEFRNIEQCNDFQKLASFVDVTAKAWILEREEYKLWDLKSDIRDDVNLLRNRWSQGHEFPSIQTGGSALVASDDGRRTFGVFRDERHPGKLSFDIGIKNVRRNINGREKNCDLVYTNGKLFIKTAPDGYSPFTGRSEGVEMFKPHVSDIELFCEEFKAFHEDVQKFNESIVAKENIKDNGIALTLTDEGLAKVSDYHHGAEDVVKLQVSAEDVVKLLPDFYGPNRADDNFLTLNFDSENPLVLEFKKDFVKTKVLDVFKEPSWVDEPEVRISYQQGNKVGTMYILKQEYESRAGFYEAETVQQTVSSMIAHGKLAHIPDLKEKPLIEDQSFILQEIYRRSLSDPQGMVFIDEKNCGEFLSDEQKSVLEPEEYAYAVKERLRQEKYDNPLLADEFQFHEFVDNEPFVTVFAHFPAKFTHEAMDAKEMLLAADAVLMDLAKAADRGDNAGQTFEKALEKRGIDKEDFMEQVKKAGRSREVIEGASIAGGAIRLESQQDRKEAAKVLSGWLKKPGEKIAKEIEKLQEKNRAQGR